jgi:uncharacterized membrane protein
MALTSVNQKSAKIWRWPDIHAEISDCHIPLTGSKEKNLSSRYLIKIFSISLSLSLSHTHTHTHTHIFALARPWAWVFDILAVCQQSSNTYEI